MIIMVMSGWINRGAINSLIALNMALTMALVISNLKLISEVLKKHVEIFTI